MNRVAKFEKVSYEQFKIDVIEHQCDLFGHSINHDHIRDWYDKIRLPERATIGSAGYDFFYPFPSKSIQPDSNIIIPTGIKCEMDEGYWLGLFPKSKFGINYRAMLDDTISVIDQDYYDCESNEGHIFVRITNNDHNRRLLQIKQDKAYCQGIILPFYLTVDDRVTATRKGGLGSTNT